MPKYYHATPTRNEKSILSKGIVPVSPIYGSTQPAVFVDTDPFSAWAEAQEVHGGISITVFEVNIPEEFEHTGESETELVSFSSIPSKYIKVYKRIFSELDSEGEPFISTRFLMKYLRDD